MIRSNEPTPDLRLAGNQLQMNPALNNETRQADAVPASLTPSARTLGRADGGLECRVLGRMDYGAALDLQEQLVRQRLAGECGDLLLMVEHPDVYTIGRRRDQSSLRDAVSLPHPVHIISRGGQATWHGPGQLVAYPILDLNPRGRDLHHYLRALESVVIRVAAEFGVIADRADGQTGVWVGNRKLASIGVGVRRWVSYHGLAFNVNPSMAGFGAIIPCGIADVTMTSLELERRLNDPGSPPIHCAEVADALPGIFVEVMERELPRRD